VITLAQSLTQIGLFDGYQGLIKEKATEGGFPDNCSFKLHTAVCTIKIIVTGSWFAFRKKLIKYIQ